MVITLPDGTFKTIFTVGEIKITPTFTLYQVLLVPDFKYNLLSVGKILHIHKNITAQFTSTVFSGPYH